MIRLRPEGVFPLEVWNLPVGGRPLQAWRRTPRFASALREVVEGLRRDLPPPGAGTLRPAVRERASSVSHIYLTGGGATEPGLAQGLRAAGFSVSLAEAPRFAAAQAGLTWGAACVDVGQTSLKLARCSRRLSPSHDVTSVERDLVAAPHRDETPLAARSTARASTIRFLSGAIAAHARELPLVLALPCELSDEGVLSGCTYCWKKGDETLLRELAEAAKVDWERLQVLNDAELAAVSAQLDASVPAGEVTLVLTVGFGVGAALLEKVG
ncbi:MAG: hypothetical protein KF915_18515 [Polyangiaceae bacterium]|nr:hypothetical protein [Polyangiaceae bacterium]